MTPMTEEQKVWIDDASYTELLSRWRFSPSGDEMFNINTESCDYFKKVMAEKRGSDADHTAASKQIGWYKC